MIELIMQMLPLVDNKEVRKDDELLLLDGKYKIPESIGEVWKNFKMVRYGN